MDAIEATRQRAAELHRERVTEGQDPSDPYALAMAEAKRRDIEVTAVVAGAAQLRGGRALYDPDGGIIVHEQTGSAFMDAFLVSHELGHDEYGGHTEVLTTSEIDVVRQAGGSSRSEGQVVDYHRRNRREIQMDMFAREFLVPRELVRKFHLKDQMTAQQIADRLQAPLDVILVQLFDAVLLPAQQLIASSPAVSKPLNDEQSVAAVHEGTAYLLEAGPGTGKTQTLVGRVMTLKAIEVDPEKVLVLTFSNKAAGELLDRITPLWPEAAGAIWTGTFHSFGLDLIRRFHNELGLPSELRLIDQAEAVGLLEDVFPRLKLEHFKDVWDPTDHIRTLLSAISRAKDEVADVPALRALADEMLTNPSNEDARIRAEKALECALVYEAYETLKRERNLLDFGDLVSLPVRLLENNPAVRDYVQGLYHHVLVDEYQDVNRASVRLLKALKPSGENLWVVGDAKQAIYRFRGASSKNVARFTKDFPEGNLGRLRTNYRSSSEICATFARFASQSMQAASDGFVVDAFKGASGVLPTYTAAGDKVDEAQRVAEAICKARQDGYPLRDQAVLCKGNDRLAEIARHLEANGVPVLFLGPLFVRPEVRDLLALLSLVVDPRAMGIVRAATMPEFSMSLDDVDQITTYLRHRADIKPLEWREMPINALVLSERGARGFSALQKAFSDVDPSDSAWSVVCDLLFNQTRCASAYSNLLDHGDANPALAIWQFQNFLRAAAPDGAGLPISRMLDHIRRLVILQDERDLRELPLAAQNIDAVRLLTIHGSKGLEFPVVHLPTLSHASLPRASGHARIPPLPDGLIEGDGGSIVDAIKTGHDEEQASIFFVALSRAEHQLHLYAPTRTATGQSKPSRYIDALGETIQPLEFDQPAMSAIGDEHDEIDIQFSEPPTITLSQLSLFERCPRRFFYTYLLRLGGRRRETPFMAMHNAVQVVVDSVCAKIGEDVSTEDALCLLDAAWTDYGPTDHGYAGDYLDIARDMVRALIDLRPGASTYEAPQPDISMGACSVRLRLDECHVAADGRRVFRRIRSGKKSSAMANNLAAAALQLGAEQEDARAEYAFLTGAETLSVNLSDSLLAKRRVVLKEVGDAIVNGLYHPKVEMRRGCPQCPAFFVCGASPAGSLVKKNLD